jgi:predicted secreted protein
MAVFNGTDLVLKTIAEAGGSEFILAHSTSCTLSINVDTIDVSSKESGGKLDVLGGLKSFELSADGLMEFAATSTTKPQSLNQLMQAGTAVTFTFALDTLAGYKYTGSALVTSIEITGGTEDASTYSVSMSGTGELLQTSI